MAAAAAPAAAGLPLPTTDYREVDANGGAVPAAPATPTAPTTPAGTTPAASSASSGASDTTGSTPSTKPSRRTYLSNGQAVTEADVNGVMTPEERKMQNRYGGSAS